MTELDLRAFGYALGRYWCRCVDCRQRFDGDKRAWRCLPCALERRSDQIDALAASRLEMHDGAMIL